MEVTYDREAKAIYFKLNTLKYSHTEELVPGSVNIDRTEEGGVIGLEVLGIDCITEITKGLNRVI
jgi:uncharacterized protein YuzE